MLLLVINDIKVIEVFQKFAEQGKQSLSIFREGLNLIIGIQLRVLSLVEFTEHTLEPLVVLDSTFFELQVRFVLDHLHLLNDVDLSLVQVQELIHDLSEALHAFQGLCDLLVHS